MSTGVPLETCSKCKHMYLQKYGHNCKIKDSKTHPISVTVTPSVVADNHDGAIEAEIVENHSDGK